MAELLANLGFNTWRMEEATKTGFMTATDLADYLVLKNVPFREAHGIVGRAVAFCINKGCELTDLNLDDIRQFSPVIGKDVFEVLSVQGSVNSRISAGGTAMQRVEEALCLAEHNMGIKL
jgi:argininosuccinate lyase